jgi:microcystin-dependent protein
MYKTFTTTGATDTTFVLPDPATVANGAWIKIHNTNLWKWANITGVVSLATNPQLSFGQEITIQCTGVGWIGTITRAYSLPIGSIGIFSFETLSWLTGYMTCNGSTLNTADYPELFAAIGNNYGGSGSTFKLPDLRGLFLRGYDSTGAIDVDAASRLRGDGKIGNYVGGVQQDAFQAHTHTTTDTVPEIPTDGVYAIPSSTSGTHLQANIRTSGSTGGNETRPMNMSLIFGIKFAD